jgi:integrase
MSERTVPKNGFTTKFLDNLKPKPERFEMADPGAKGLRLRVSPGGTMTFIWYYRDVDTCHRYTIGRYGDGDSQITLAQARSKLIAVKKKWADGIKPHSEAAGAPKTVAELCEVFYERRIVPIRKRPDAVRQVLDHDIIPVIGNKRIVSITTPTLTRVVDKVVDRGAKAHAGKVLATLKQLFKYAQVRGYTDISPAYPLNPGDLGVVTNVRERALDIDEEGEAQTELVEISALWRALDKAPKLSPQNRYGTKILLLTGVRSGELRLARWEHIDFNNATWKIPASNTKNAKAWTVPLSPLVLDLFERLQAVAEDSPWVLPSFAKELTGEFTGKVSDKNPMTDKALARSVKRLFSLKDAKGNSLLPIDYFTPHDLRRTLRTHLSRLGVAVHIAEKCLNHSLGRLEQTYDRHTYIDERREALNKWATDVALAVNSRETESIEVYGRS